MTLHNNKRLIFFVKLILAFGFIYLAIVKLDSTNLVEHLQNIEWVYLLFSLISIFFAAIFSARRWNCLLNKLGYRISFTYTYILYSKGIAINSILPGGVAGGDIFKSISLISYLKGVNVEQEKLKARVILSILIDRLIGFWSLSILSLLACLILASQENLWSNAIPPILINSYLTFLISVLLAPFILNQLNQFLLTSKLSVLNSVRQILNLVNKKRLIHTTFIYSLLVQVFSILSFSFAIRATGTSLDQGLVFAIAMGVFTVTALPLSVAGFGLREFSMVLIFPLLGQSPEQGFVSSLLFGLVGTLQGLINLSMWLVPSKSYTKSLK